MRKVVCIKKISPEIDDKLLKMGFLYHLESPSIEMNFWTGVDGSNLFEHFNETFFGMLEDFCDEIIECKTEEEFYEKCRNI